jgi:hypothetical protein
MDREKKNETLHIKNAKAYFRPLKSNKIAHYQHDCITLFTVVIKPVVAHFLYALNFLSRMKFFTQN